MSKKNSNKKIIIVVIAVVIVGFIAFDWISGFSDGALDDISTNEYIERGASFELFALADVCKINPSYILCHLAGDTETTSTPDEDEDEAEVTEFYCKSNVKMSYKDDIRNTWKQYGSTWSDTVTLDLASTQGGGKINEIKGEIYMKCDQIGNDSIKVKSGSVSTLVYDGFNPDSLGYGILKINDSLKTNVVISSSVDPSSKKGLVGTINISESQIEEIEKKLSVDSSGNVGITFYVKIDTKFLLDNKETVSAQTVHQSSMKFSKLLEEVKVVTQANSRYERISIESIERTAYPKLDLMGSSGDKLNTGIDIKKNQIKVTTSMAKYYENEGSPIIRFAGPDGTNQKYSAIKAGKSGDTQFFETYWTLPFNAKEGKWNVYVTNVNRDQTGTSSFYVLNSVNDSTDDCKDNFDCPNLTPTVDEMSWSVKELKELEKLRVGVMWKVVDGGGRTLEQGNSFVDGGSVIPQLALISEVVDDRTGDTLKFEKIQIQPILQFEDPTTFTPFRNWDYAQSYDPEKIPITLSIVGEIATITKYIQPTAQGSSNVKLLGTGFMSQADADKLAETANYQVGDRFTVEANIGGEFVLRNQNTNNEYDFKFDGVKISQEFQYGVIGTSEDPRQGNEDDKKYNECLEQGKNPSFDNFGGLFSCITDEQYAENECKEGGNNWINGECVFYHDDPIPNDPTDDELQKAIDECNEQENSRWDQGQLLCFLESEPPNKQPRNVDTVDVDVDTKNGKIISINGENLDLGLDLGTNIVEGIDNIYLIAVVVGFVAVIVALRARRQSSYGLMNKYG